MSTKAVFARLRELSCVPSPPAVLAVAALQELSRVVARITPAFSFVRNDGCITHYCALGFPDRGLPSGVARVLFESAQRSASLDCAPRKYGVGARPHIIESDGSTAIVHFDMPGNGQIHGRLSLLRSDTPASFNRTEIANLECAVGYISRALLQADWGDDAGGDEGCFREGVAVCDEAGRLLESTADCEALLLLAISDQLTPDTINEARASLRETLRRLVAQSRADRLKGHIDVVVRNKFWGMFRMNVSTLESAANTVIRSAVQIRHLRPKALEHADRLSAADLTVQQRRIALMLAAGATNRNISAVLGISVNTVSYHVKCIFNRLNVNGRDGLRNRLDATQRAVGTANSLEPLQDCDDVAQSA